MSDFSEIESQLDKVEIVDVVVPGTLPWVRPQILHLVKLWSEPQGEPTTGEWCDKCLVPSAASLIMVVGSGTKVFQRVKTTYCLECHEFSQEEIDG